MTFLPQNIKFNKFRKKLKFKKKNKKTNTISRKTYHLKTKKYNYITIKIVETLRQIITKKIKPRGKI
jgi:ribosomal protein L16/L10AE